MKSVHITLSSALILLSLVYCQTIDEYVDVECEYQRGGAVCNCEYSSEVNIYLSFLSAHFFHFTVKWMRNACVRNSFVEEKRNVVSSIKQFILLSIFLCRHM